jgi:hypothetical protein
MTGSHEVRGSIPLGSTKSSNTKYRRCDLNPNRVPLACAPKFGSLHRRTLIHSPIGPPDSGFGHEGQVSECLIFQRHAKSRSDSLKFLFWEVTIPLASQCELIVL